MKLPIHSTEQLARSLGLSRWTVSRALNGHLGISPATVARVVEAASQAGFAPNVLGRGLRSGKTDLIGVSLPDLEDYFLAPKISRLQEAVSAHGLQTLLQISNTSEGSESAALGRFAAMRCRGVVVIASRLRDGHEALRALRALEIPIVFVDPFHSQSGVVVSTDRSLAMKSAIEHLHALGHRSVATAGIHSQSAYGKQRTSGLRQACLKWNWDFARDVIFLNSDEPLEDFHLGRKLAGHFLEELYPKVRAVVALNDRIAFGMIQFFAERKIRVPEEVSIIGYDDSAFSEIISPALTTFDPGVNELIDEAVGLLVSNPVRTMVRVKPRLVVRESTAEWLRPSPKLCRSRRSGNPRR